jgi:hypothetical protein
MPSFIVRPKEKSEDPNDYSERNSTPRRPELTVLNLVVNPLKTEMISIKGHENHSAQNSHHYHDLTYQSFCKTHVSHNSVVLSSIIETHSRGLDAFNPPLAIWTLHRRGRTAPAIAAPACAGASGTARCEDDSFQGS